MRRFEVVVKHYHPEYRSIYQYTTVCLPSNSLYNRIDNIDLITMEDYTELEQEIYKEFLKGITLDDGWEIEILKISLDIQHTFVYLDLF